MRWIVVLVLLLTGIGWLMAEVRIGEPSLTQLTSSDWRKTRDGWERPTWLAPPIEGKPAIHPAVVGIIQLLVSMLALVAFSGESSARRARPRAIAIGSPLPRRVRGRRSSSKRAAPHAWQARLRTMPLAGR